jgi:hypothetical protein
VQATKEHIQQYLAKMPKCKGEDGRKEEKIGG